MSLACRTAVVGCEVVEFCLSFHSACYMLYNTMCFDLSLNCSKICGIVVASLV